MTAPAIDTRNASARNVRRATSGKQPPRRDIYQEVTDRIIAALETDIALLKEGRHQALASVIFVRRSDAQAYPVLDRPDLAIVDIEVHSASEIAITKR